MGAGLGRGTRFVWSECPAQRQHAALDGPADQYHLSDKPNTGRIELRFEVIPINAEERFVRDSGGAKQGDSIEQCVDGETWVVGSQPYQDGYVAGNGDDFGPSAKREFVGVVVRQKRQSSRQSLNAIDSGVVHGQDISAT